MTRTTRVMALGIFTLILSGSAAFCQTTPELLPAPAPAFQQPPTPGQAPNPAPNEAPAPGKPVQELPPLDIDLPLPPLDLDLPPLPGKRGPGAHDFLDSLLGAPAAPKAEELERVYAEHWQRLKDRYPRREATVQLNAWKDKYKGKLTDMLELNRALKALYASLNDEWTVFRGFEDLAEELIARGRKLELGLQLKAHPDGSVRVRTILFGSPAHRSQLREGFIITSIDGKEAGKLSEEERNKLLLGSKGSLITLSYRASSHSRERKVELTLAELEADRVIVDVRQGALYVRLPDFINKSHIPQIKKEMRERFDEAGGKLKGIVLDLRHNLGGHPTKALEMAALFVKEGTAMRFKERDGRTTKIVEHIVERDSEAERDEAAADDRAYLEFLQQAPMRVLANGSSASASEILLAALQDSGRARVIGTKTVGKGVAYLVMPTETGIASMTAAIYVRPNGQELHGEGITPDVTVNQPAKGKCDRQLAVALRELKRASRAAK